MEQEIFIPRVRGRIGQATEPPEMAGKWFFEVFLAILGGDEGKPIGQFGPYDTEEKALQELRNACRLVCETVEKEMTGEVSGKFIDIKTNTVRNWEEH